MTTTVGTFEAKTHFTKIITQVIDGEEIFITRRGVQVAKIVPVAMTIDKQSVETCIKRLDTLADEMQLGRLSWDELKTYRDVGKK